RVQERRAQSLTDRLLAGERMNAVVLLRRDLRADGFRPSRCHARILCSAARKTCCAPSNLVNRGSCRGTEIDNCRECRTFRMVPIEEPPFLCSTRNRVTCHL